jgi:small-conductance mechanosensitive channel
MASQLQNHKAAAKRQALTPVAAAAKAQRVSRKSAVPKAAAGPPAKFEAQAQKFITTYLAPLKAKFNMAVADDERMKNLLPDLPKGSEALAKKAMLWADGSEADIKKILSEEAPWPEGYTLKQFFDEAKDEYNEHDQQLHNFIKALDYAEECHEALEAEAEHESRRSSPVAASPAGGINLT